jgi:hypothetical protein
MMEKSVSRGRGRPGGIPVHLRSMVVRWEGLRRRWSRMRRSLTGKRSVISYHFTELNKNHGNAEMEENLLIWIIYEMMEEAVLINNSG